jgi:hypothetical protein
MHGRNRQVTHWTKLLALAVAVALVVWIFDHLLVQALLILAATLLW